MLTSQSYSAAEPRAGSAALKRVANVEKNLEVQLLSAISEVERRHLGLITRVFRALERFTIHLVEVIQNRSATSRHCVSLRARFAAAVHRQIGKTLERSLGILSFEDQVFRRSNYEAARIEWIRRWRVHCER